MNRTLLLQGLCVVAGGAVGGLLRWRAGAAWNGVWPGVPLGTLAVNVGGGLAVGLAAAWLAVHPNEWWRLFLVVGLLGGLTTFSSFSAESLALLQRGQVALAALHTAAHVLGALGFAALGAYAGRAAFAPG